MNSLISIPCQLEEEAYLDHRGAMGLAGGQAFNPVWANETQTQKANLQRLEGKPISVPSHNIPSGSAKPGSDQDFLRFYDSVFEQ